MCYMHCMIVLAMLSWPNAQYEAKICTLCSSGSDAEELQALMDAEEQTSEPRTNKQDDEILALTCASLAVTADDLIKV